MPLARTLDAATPALDFEVPLQSGDPRYVDFARVRGAGAVARLRTLLNRQPSDRWLHAVFASHRGAGKSTELLHLQHDVSDRYFTIYFEANVELDPLEFSMEELLLVIARVVEEQMRDRGTSLPARELQKVESWFAEVVFATEEGKSFLAGVHTEAKAEGGIPFFAKLVASVTAGLKVESSHRSSVKSTLKKFPGTLITLVNNLLDAAATILEDQGKRLLLVIDNMDRYDPEVIDKLLVASQDQIRTLHTHLIITPPIILLLKPESQMLDTVFRCETLPTIKLRDKSQGYSEFSGDGRDWMLKVLGQRIDIDRLLPDAAARDRLIAASGGAIRELLELTQDATLDATGETITLSDVNSALDRRRNTFRNRININGWWDVLVRIAETKDVDNDPDALEVVFHRLAFQYNGEIWYDVHPLVAELLEGNGLLKDPFKKKAAGRKPASKRSSKKAPQ